MAVGGSALSGYSKVMQGNEASRAAHFEQQQLQTQAMQYRTAANQAEAIVAMQLGSLANLERENLRGEHKKLLEDITGYLQLLSDEANIRAVVREDMVELKKKYGDVRAPKSEEELGDIDKADSSPRTMVVTLSQKGYITARR
jgi:DNA gyrase subunit A